MNAMLGLMVSAPQAIAGSDIAHQLQAWLARHQPQLVDFHDDAKYFGNIIMVFTKNGLDMRFVVDRGELIVDVGHDGCWQADRTIDAFMRAVPVSEGRSWPEFDPFADPKAVLDALSDPQLPAFMRVADIEALEAIGFAVAAS